MQNIPELEQETGEFLLSRYGNAYALGFKGDENFVKRGYNLAYNFGITTGALLKDSDKIYYVLTNQVKLLEGLKLYYYNRTIKDKTVEITSSEETDFMPQFDENLAWEKAELRAKNFIETQIKKENFMFDTYYDRFCNPETL